MIWRKIFLHFCNYLPFEKDLALSLNILDFPLPKDWLIDWLFTVLRPAQEYFTYMETSPLPVKGLSLYQRIDWLIIYGFTSRSRIFHLYGDVTIAGEGAAKFRPMFGAQGLWAGKDLYRTTPAVTRDLGFSGLIRRTAPFSRLLRHTIYSNPDPHGDTKGWFVPSFIEIGLLVLEEEIFLKINIFKYGLYHCGPSPPPRTMTWTILNLHYIRKLLCKYDLFWLCVSTEEDF
jgi:hypothetical protein